MSIFIQRCVALLFLLSSVTPCAQVSTALRQQDLDYVTDQLPKLHTNFFFQLDRGTFQKAAAELASRITTASDAEFYVGLSQLIAMAGDAHTAIALNGAAAAAVGFKSLPLGLRWLDDGVFVTATTSADSRALGTKLIAVGGIPIDDVMRRMATVIPHGNNQWVRYMSQNYLPGQQILEGLHIVPAGSTAAFTFRTLAGQEFTVELSPSADSMLISPDPNAGSLPDYRWNSGANYWFKYSGPNRLLYFKYNRCIDDPSTPFTGFANAVLQTIDRNPVDTFVFDLRGNTGGNSSLWNPLAEGMQQRLPVLAANPRFRIYAIIDKGTFSSGMDNAMSLKQPFPPELVSALPGVDLTNLAVRVIGEATGGEPSGYGEVRGFMLPGSRLPGQYSTKYFAKPSYIPDLPSFLPDIPVAIRSTDYFARHDPAMAAVLARTADLPLASAGSAIAVNGASYRTDQGIAPGSFAAIFGSFGQTPDLVTVGGVAAQLVSATPYQVNVLVPAELSPGLQKVTVQAGGAELASGQFTISVCGPGLFVLNPTDPSQPGAVENQDYRVNSANNPAATGSVLQIFATGYANLDASRDATQVFLAGVPAHVAFSGTVAPGLWQINAVVPAGISGQVPLFVTAGGMASNAVTVYVQ
jgi:uncharacterized protein (TIGR03437 family)